MQKNFIEISYNEDCEMMEIKNTSGEVIFYGNYWDFLNEPKFIKGFLESLNLKVKTNSKLKC